MNPTLNCTKRKPRSDASLDVNGCSSLSSQRSCKIKARVDRTGSSWEHCSLGSWVAFVRVSNDYLERSTAIVSSQACE